MKNVYEQYMYNIYLIYTYRFKEKLSGFIKILKKISHI